MCELIPFTEYNDSAPEEEKSPSVIQALASQDRILEYLIDNTIHEHVDELTNLMNLYEVAAQEGDIVAMSNHLRWIILIGIGVMGVTDQFIKNAENISKEGTKLSDVLKSGLLSQSAKIRKSLKSEADEMKREYIDNCEKSILQNIYNLKQAGYHEIADYYNAIRYVFGVVRNTLSTELNRIIGHEMIRSLVLMRNPYVEDYFNACDEMRKLF